MITLFLNSQDPTSQQLYQWLQSSAPGFVPQYVHVVDVATQPVPSYIRQIPSLVYQQQLYETQSAIDFLSFQISEFHKYAASQTPPSRHRITTTQTQTQPLPQPTRPTQSLPTSTAPSTYAQTLTSAQAHANVQQSVRRPLTRTGNITAEERAVERQRYAMQSSGGTRQQRHPGVRPNALEHNAADIAATTTMSLTPSVFDDELGDQSAVDLRAVFDPQTIRAIQESSRIDPDASIDELVARRKQQDSMFQNIRDSGSLTV